MATTDLKERARLLQSMPECSPDMTDVPAPSAPPVETSYAVAAEDSPAAASGFALEVRLETAQLAVDSSSILPTTQAGLFLGHRSPSIMLGVGLEIGRVTSSSDDPAAGSTSVSSNLVLVMPGLRAVLARSQDQRTEMIAELDVGYGVNWTSRDPDLDMDDTPSTGHFRAQAAPGIRYWVAPAFAIGATTGLRYDRFGREGTTGTASMALSIAALFGSLQLTGVF